MLFGSFLNVAVGILYVLVGCLSVYIGCLKVSAGLSQRSIEASLEDAEDGFYRDDEILPATAIARRK